MIADILLILGGVACIEGLVLALAPLRLADLLATLARIDPGTRRALGLGVATLGLGLIWVARIIAA